MTVIAKFKKKFYFVVASYFKLWANISFRRWNPRTIMITGSAGKTTMLNLIESQLGKKAHYSHNANSAYGIAFDILGMHGITGSKLYWLVLIFGAPIRAIYYRRHEKYYVVECDGERPREAEFIAKWLRPEVSIWVSLGRSHAVFYEDVVANGEFETIDDAITHEFASIPTYTKKLALIDGDNSEMVASTKIIDAEVAKLSKSSLKEYTVYPDRAIFKFAKHSFEFDQPMPKDVAIQLAMLERLMEYLKLPVNYHLTNFKMPPARSNFLQGKNGLRIIDSSYNAHIISMTTMLETFKLMKVAHKWLVIGDIIDQGKLEGEEHKKLAKLLLDMKVEKIVLLGRRTKQYCYPLMKDKCDVVSFSKPQEALKYLEENLTGKETVLFKGSQYLEWIIEKLLEDPADAKKLARQDEAHRRRRASWGLE